MPSRRDLIAMTADEVRTYLSNRYRLILVTNGLGGYPHPMPMNFVFDKNEYILMTTFGKSQKVRNLRRDPKAALLIESGTSYAELKSVLIRAEVDIIDDHSEVTRVTELLLKKECEYSDKPLASLEEQAMVSAHKKLVLRVKPDSCISWDHSKLGEQY